jgi:uncharacterized protein (DUF488 family)
MNTMEKIIYTIGHSTRRLDEFISLLQTFSIEMLADVRSYPGSQRYPHFNKENLQKSLPQYQIMYQHFPALGGRRKALKNSKSTAWKNAAFRGYADYMETDEFKKGIIKLEDTAAQYKTAFMCSEAVWWRCHRSMIADYLKAEGWKVLHILNDKKVEEHPYTAPAKIVNGKISYKSVQQILL